MTRVVTAGRGMQTPKLSWVGRRSAYFVSQLRPLLFKKGSATDRVLPSTNWSSNFQECFHCRG